MVNPKKQRGAAIVSGGDQFPSEESGGVRNNSSSPMSSTHQSTQRSRAIKVALAVLTIVLVVSATFVTVAPTLKENPEDAGLSNSPLAKREHVKLVYVMVDCDSKNEKKASVSDDGTSLTVRLPSSRKDGKEGIAEVVEAAAAAIAASGGSNPVGSSFIPPPKPLTVVKHLASPIAASSSALVSSASAPLLLSPNFNIFAHLKSAFSLDTTPFVTNSASAFFTLDSGGEAVIGAELPESTADCEALAKRNQATYLKNYRSRIAAERRSMAKAREALKVMLGAAKAHNALHPSSTSSAAISHAEDVLEELQDALYFNGVPSFLREDWAAARTNDTVYPHALFGANYNNDPTALNFVSSVEDVDYTNDIRPHIFSKRAWANWYKAIGLSKPPARLKGPSRAQSFDGRYSWVDVKINERFPVKFGGPDTNLKTRDTRIKKSLVAAAADGSDDATLSPPHLRYTSVENNGESDGDEIVVRLRPVTLSSEFGGNPPIVKPEEGEPNHRYHQEVVKLAAAFSIYDANPRSESVIHAYTTACVGGADCGFIGNHIDRVYEFGLGYYVWFVNTQDPSANELADLLSRAFPTRFIVMRNEQRVGASGTWNRFIDMFFKKTSNPLPWFLNANGDFFAKENDLEEFMQFLNGKLHSNKKHTVVKFQHYSYFVYTYRAYMVLGSFDESVYPAYAEDVEIFYRAVSMGVKFDDYGAREHQYHHVGSASLRDPIMGQQHHRWGRDHFIKQKWNINMYSAHWENVNFAPLHSHPWGISSIPHRSSYAIDPDHVLCIQTGRGAHIPRHPDKCFWNGGNVRRLMPKGDQRLPNGFLDLIAWNGAPRKSTKRFFGRR